MEPDPTDPFGPGDDGSGGGEKDPAEAIEPGWWALVGGVWRWITEPLPNNFS